jgi:hypothetical protein
VDEYLNEKIPSDSEVYLKVHQYQYKGNTWFKEQWIACLIANKAKQFWQLTSQVDVCAAINQLQIIPALLLQGMKFSSIPRVLTTNYYKVCVPSTPTATRPELSRIGDGPWFRFIARVMVLLCERQPCKDTKD